MSIWQTYPETYRSTEVGQLLAAVRGGNCAAVLGLSGSGKSNLLGFIASRVQAPPQFVLVDCNRMSTRDLPGLTSLIQEAWPKPAANDTASIPTLEANLDHYFESPAARLCLLLDRYDALQAENGRVLDGWLRSLRDAHKYKLTYILGTRRQPDPQGELAELFFANTLWLGPLTDEDALWTAGAFASRQGLDWNETTLQKIIEVSRGYPSLLKGVCEAHAAGVPLELQPLLESTPVRRRIAEFWVNSPSDEELRLSRLDRHPLLLASRSGVFDTTSLTAKELALLEYFQAHPGQVCEKDELIAAVWPEDRISTHGLRDDSLAQLVHRLRRKIEPNPDAPGLIHNVPGRGYRFIRRTRGMDEEYAGN